MSAASFTNLPSGTRRFLPAKRRTWHDAHRWRSAALWLVEFGLFAAAMAIIVIAGALAQ